MSKKKRKPLPRIGGKATVVTPGGKESYTRKKLVELDAKVPTVTERTRVDAGLAAQGSGGSYQTAVEEGTSMTNLGDPRLPYDVARKILGAAKELKVDPSTLPDMEPEEVTRLINGNPDIALEGLTRLGRVLPMPHTPPDTPLHNSLELKARVVNDLRTARVDRVVDDERAQVTNSMIARTTGGSTGFLNVTAEHARNGLVVDVQAVYDRWMATSKGNDLYELVLSPPWMNAVLVFSNSAGNVWAMHMIGSDITTDEWDEDRGGPSAREEIQWQPQPPADHTIEWERVRWVYSVQVYCGGMGQHGLNDVATTEPAMVPTIGPLMIWRIAVYEDGSAADVHWSHIVPQIPMHKFNNALGTFCETLNMTNCVNVTVAYPERPMQRAQRRRLDRLGVRFSEIHIKPASKSYRGNGQALADMDTALHGVRGHYATYGKDGRGLLFGKLAGRFWIPPHIRGSRDNGEVVQSYVTD